MRDRHPVFRDTSTVTFFLLFWLAAWIIQSAAYSFLFMEDLLHSLALTLPFLCIILPFVILLWYPTRYMRFEGHTVPRLLFSHAVLALISAVLVSRILPGFSRLFPNIFHGAPGLYPLPFMPAGPDATSYPLSGMLSVLRGYEGPFILTLIYYFMSSAFYYLFHYYSDYRDSILNEARLEKALRDSEIQSLRYQINPHFLFNALNSIASLSLVRGEDAHRMTIQLSDYFRNTLQTRPGQMQSLRGEIRSAELYLDIETMRFGERMSYELDCGDTDLELQVPSMVLQPLLENAVKHGVQRSPDLTRIRVQCSLKQGVFTLTVENSCHSAPEKGRVSGTGTGLRNIQDRLRLMYGEDGGMHISRLENLFRVQLHFPVELSTGQNPDQSKAQTAKAEKKGG